VQPGTTSRTMADDADSDDEDERQHSSGSDEEDLDSMPRIHQLPESDDPAKSAVEDMDVSSADG